jgi:hypothetical protein
MTEHYENWAIIDGEVKKLEKGYPHYEDEWIKIGQTPSEIQYSVRLKNVETPNLTPPTYWVNTLSEAKKAAEFILRWYV